MDGSGSKALGRGVAVVALWTVLGLLMAAHFQLRGDIAGPFAQHALDIVSFYWLWALLTPLVFHLGKRFDPLARPRAPAVSAHLLAAAAVTLLHLGLYIPFIRLIRGAAVAQGCLTHLPCLVRGHAAGDVATYLVVLGVSVVLRESRRAEERERAGLRLRAQLADARLAALSMQLHPHFFFNAMNTVSVLVLKGERRAAISAIARIGELLRIALADGPEQVPLDEETAFVEQYLEIEQLRFGDRLHFELDVDPAVRESLVPRLLLQPLVENAIRHGLSSRAGEGGRVRLRAERDGDRLVLRVMDNGPGPVPPPDERGEGVGLGNTRKRLAELHGSAARVTLEREGEWTVATVALPLTTPKDTSD